MKLDFKKILYYAELSSLVYKSNNEILQKYPSAKIKEDLGLDLKVFVLTDDIKRIYTIVCRGTVSFKDAKLDVEYKKSDENVLHIPLHIGFYKSAFTIYDKIRWLYLREAYKIQLAGHSLGGAIAVILAMLLVKDYVIDNIITFGQPKLMTKVGVIKYRLLPLLRIINKCDPVPLTPPFTLYSLFNHWPYRHGGREIKLLENESYAYLDEYLADRIFESSFWGHLIEEKVSEHFIDNYIKNIKLKI